VTFFGFNSFFLAFFIGAGTHKKSVRAPTNKKVLMSPVITTPVSHIKKWMGPSRRLLFLRGWTRAPRTLFFFFEKKVGWLHKEKKAKPQEKRKKRKKEKGKRKKKKKKKRKKEEKWQGRRRARCLRLLL
jgi:flagellar biosynthesis component FlhA